MLDQMFVLLKHWLLGYSPAMLQPAVSILLTILPILLVFPVLFALTTVLERKGLGRMQNRYGPNRVGFYGILQPMADAVKSLTKEDIVPASADHTARQWDAASGKGTMEDGVSAKAEVACARSHSGRCAITRVSRLFNPTRSTSDARSN